jgi:hypothetical protein
MTLNKLSFCFMEEMCGCEEEVIDVKECTITCAADTGTAAGLPVLTQKIGAKTVHWWRFL